jgi:hypothetical protein
MLVVDLFEMVDVALADGAIRGDVIAARKFLAESNQNGSPD